MWLIAETIDGIYLEYWHKVGHAASVCILSMATEASAAQDLDAVKAALNKYKVEPPEVSV